jgi:hypothetical protein
MTRSRLVLFVSVVIVALGVVAGVGVLWLDSARADVGPLPGEGLVLPAETRFVMGVDVKRFIASPMFERYASREAMRPKALRDLEKKTGLDPARDIDHVVVAGSQEGGPQSKPLVLVLGRFDREKIGRSLETEAKANARTHEGVKLYSFADKSGTSAVAFLDAQTLVFGPTDRVETVAGSHSRGESPLRNNAEMLALVESVKPGSTFWMVGDRNALSALPSAIPGQGGQAAMNLPPLQSLTLTGDFAPQLSLALTGVAADEAAATKLADVVRGFVALMSLQAAQKPELQELASAFNIATEANRVLISARIPYELLDALQPQKKEEEPVGVTAEADEEPPAEEASPE